MDVANPATGAVIGSMPDCTEAETNEAITAAQKAMVAWRARPHAERADLLMTGYELMMSHKQDLGQILSAEQGKPLAEAEGEIGYGAAFVRWFAEEARRINGTVIPVAGKKLLALKEPIGIAAIITPWNFPNAMITHKVGLPWRLAALW